MPGTSPSGPSGRCPTCERPWKRGVGADVEQRPNASFSDPSSRLQSVPVGRLADLARQVPGYGVRSWFLPAGPGQARARLVEVEEALAGDPLIECRWAEVDSAPSVLGDARQLLDKRTAFAHNHELVGHQPTAADPTVLVLIPDCDQVWADREAHELSALLTRKGRQLGVAIVAACEPQKYDMQIGAGYAGQILRAALTTPRHQQ
jgi:hypothetical protein